MSPLRVSAVVPTHNSRPLTLRCLETVFAADPPVAEVWVADDASGDGTLAAIETRFPTARLLRADTRRGFTVNANRALERADGDLLLLLNSDTEVAPGAIAALVEAFESEPGLGIAGAQLHYPDGEPQWSGGREPSLLWLFALTSGLPRLLRLLPGYRVVHPLTHEGSPTVDWVSGAALAMRREVWQEVGPLDEGFAFYCQDLDLCTRARRAGWRVAVVPGCRVLHHHGATIGKRPGAFAGRQQSTLLWLDLLRWAQKNHGPRWVTAARRALGFGARCRLAGRSLLRPFLSHDDAAAWSRDGRALRRALSALRSSTADGLS